MADRLFTDRALQDTYRALMQDSVPAGHVDEATWDLIAAGEIDPPRRDAAFDHILSCARCARIWHGVQELQRAATSDGLIAPDAPLASPWHYSRFVPLAVAATLVLAIAGVAIVQQRDADPGALRSSASLPPVDGLMLAYSPAGVPTFAWTPVATATRYHVDIFTDDGRPVWSGEAVAPPMPWPDGVPRPTGAYRWRVEAVSADVPIARSRFVAIDLPR